MVPNLEMNHLNFFMIDQDYYQVLVIKIQIIADLQ
jgi:hypothetical protein